MFEGTDATQDIIDAIDVGTHSRLCMELKRKSKKSINRGVVFMQKNKKRAYPAFIREDEGMQLVYVPDFAIFTEGHDLVDAIEMARDAIGMTGKAYEEDGKELPEPSDYEEAITRAELIKSDFDYTKGYLTLVDVDFQLFDRA